MELAIVTTTINVPTLFEGYCRDFAEHKRKGINFIVIADKKTPSAARTYCEQLQATYGYSFEYMDVEDQVSYLKRFPELRAALRDLGGKLSADEMRRLNDAVDGEHRDVKQVVSDFLRAKGL